MSQFARPNSDISNSGWSPSSGTALYSLLNETAADDSGSYVEATANGSHFEVALAALTDPASGSGHVARWRAYWSFNPIAFGIAARLEMQLFQGTTLIATSQQDLVSGWNDYTYTLSAGEANSITDYTDLRFEFIFILIGGWTSPLCRVTWAEQETPGATGTAVDAAVGRWVAPDIGVGGGTQTANLDAASATWKAAAPTFFAPSPEPLGPRKRFVHVEGEGGFHQDWDDANPGTFGTLPVQRWYPNVLVSNLAASYFAFISGIETEDEYTDRPDLNPPDGLGTSLPAAFFQQRTKWRIRYDIRRGVPALGRTFGSGVAATVYSDWQYTPWFIGAAYACQPTFGGGMVPWRQFSAYVGHHAVVGAALHDAIGRFDYEEYWELTQRLQVTAPGASDLADPGWEYKRARPVEDLHVTSWSLASSVSGHVYVYGFNENTAPWYHDLGANSWLECRPGGQVPVAEMTLSVYPVSAANTLTGNDPAGYTAQVNDYRWHYSFEQEGFHLPVRARYLPSEDSLRSTYGAFDTAKGFSHLAGNPHDCTRRWTGNDTTDVSYHQAPPAGQVWARGTPPAAQLEGAPSWAMSAAAHLWGYDDGAEINATYQHRVLGELSDGTEVSDTLIGEWSAPASYRYPASGEKHWLVTFVDDGAATRGDISGPSLTTGYSWPAAGAVTGQVLEEDGLLKPTESGNGTRWFNYFVVKRDWATANLKDYLRSANRFVRGRTPYGDLARVDWLQPQFSPYFESGRLRVEDTHRFLRLFNPANWHASTNPDYTGSVAVSASGAGLAFIVTGAPALLTTRTSYRLRYFAYRYAHLRVKCSAGSASLRFGLGTAVGPGGSQMPLRAWEISTGTADTWQVFMLDLARPDKSGKMPSSPAAHGFGYVAAPAGYYQPAEAWANGGLDVWLDFGTNGTWIVEYLEGFHDGTGARTKDLLVQPLEVYGTAAQAAEYEPPPASLATAGAYPTAYVGRWITNGVVSGDLVTDLVASGTGLGFFGGWWDFLFSHMDDAALDTGIHVTRGSGAGMAWPLIDDWKFSDLPFGASLLTEKSFQSCLRVYYPQAYYGMGDLVSGAYGRTIACHMEQVVRGELFGMVPGGAGATVELHDNDTGALVVSATLDDDGFGRLPAPYGVPRPYSNDEAAQFSVVAGAIVYTTTGKLLNAYWLKTTGLTVFTDGAGYVLVASGGPRMDIGILDRFAEILQIARSVALNPRNYQDEFGRHYRVEVKDGNVWFYRSDFATPHGGFVVNTQVSGPGGAATKTQVTFDGDGSYPVVALDPVRLKQILLWQTSTDVVESASEDDGESWSEPTVPFPGGTKPAVWAGSGRDVMRAAVISGAVWLTYQAKGDPAPSAPFLMVDQDGVTIPVEDDTVGLSQAWGEGALRWTAELNVLGEGATSTWQSAEDGLSWSRVT